MIPDEPDMPRPQPGPPHTDPSQADQPNASTGLGGGTPYPYPVPSYGNTGQANPYQTPPFPAVATPREPSNLHVLVGGTLIMVLLVGLAIVVGVANTDPSLKTSGTSAPGTSAVPAALPSGTTPGGTAPVDSTERPSSANRDHWHAAYGIFVCDRYLPPLEDIGPDSLGIHTHGEGIIHIHPFSAKSSGRNATLGVFAAQVGLGFLDNGFVLPGGDRYTTATASCDERPAKVVVYRGLADEPTAQPEEYTSDFDTIRFVQDREVYTIAVVPTDVTVLPPPPDSVVTLDDLADVAPRNETTPSTR